MVALSLLYDCVLAPAPKGHADTHTHTHARTHARTHTHTHTRTQKHLASHLSIRLALLLRTQHQEVVPGPVRVVQPPDDNGRARRRRCLCPCAPAGQSICGQRLCARGTQGLARRPPVCCRGAQAPQRRNHSHVLQRLHALLCVCRQNSQGVERERAVHLRRAAGVAATQQRHSSGVCVVTRGEP